MADVARVDIEKDEIGWVLRVSNPGLRTQEYRCSSKEQAQALADVMTGAKAANGAPKGASRPAAPPSPRSPPKR
jgi:hypothetical protein